MSQRHTQLITTSRCHKRYALVTYDEQILFIVQAGCILAVRRAGRTD